MNEALKEYVHIANYSIGFSDKERYLFNEKYEFIGKINTVAHPLKSDLWIVKPSNGILKIYKSGPNGTFKGYVWIRVNLDNPKIPKEILTKVLLLKD